MKYIKTLILLALLIPQVTFGAVAVGWNATSTASNLLYPNLLNGILKVPSANEFRANFFTGGFFVGTTTATSTFAGGIKANIFNATSATASSTFANGINLTGGCFSINGTCIVGGGSGSSASTTLLSDTNTFSTTGTTTFAGNLGVGTTSPAYGKYNSGLTLGLNKNLILTTDRNTNNFLGNIIFKNEGASTTKSGLEWYGFNNPTVSRAWLVFHESLNGELDGSHGAPHLEIETSDVSGAKQGRWTVQSDCDYDCIQTFNQSEVYITRNSGQTNGNLLFNGGGQIRNTGVMQIIPNNALNTLGFRIATSTDNDIMIDVTSGTELEVQDNLNLTGNQYISGLLGIGTTSPSNQITIEKSGSSGTVAGPTIELRQNQTAINTTQNSNLGEILFSGADIFPNETGIGAKIRGEATGIWNATTNDYPTSLLFFTNPNASEALREVMRITDTGFVGIGTSSPYAKLSVVGEVVGSHFTGTTTASSTFAGGVQANILRTTSTSASSTFANGINLTGGCFSINGACITGGGGGSGATTTLLSDMNTFSTTGTTTFSAKLDANRLTSATSRVTGLVSCDTIDTDAYGNMFCGSDATGAGGSVTGNGIAGMMASWSSSSNLIATSTIMAEQVIATSTRPSHFGTNCITPDGGGGNAGSQGLEVCGSDNSITGVNLGITNTNPGTSAYGGLYLNNNEADVAVTKYAGIFLNSGNYNDVTLGSGLSTKSQLILQNSMNAMTLAVGTTTATSSYVNFLTGGFALENERMRIAGNGRIGIATTSPLGKLSILGTEDTPQLFIKGNGTQTNPVFRVQDSAGSSVLTLGGTGSMTITGTFVANKLLVGSVDIGTVSGAVSCSAITTCSFSNGGSGTGLTATVRGGSGTDSSLAITSSNHATPSGDMIRFSSSNVVLGAIAGKAIRTWNIGSTTKALGKIAMLTVTATSTSNSDLFNIDGPTPAGMATTTLFEVTADGKVGVATTSPWRTLSVVGTVAFDGLTTSTAGNAVCILANDDIVNAGGTTCATSSRRFKEFIKSLFTKESLDIVLKMQPRSFHRKVPTQSQPTGNEIGFIAEEVNDIDSRLVEYEADGVTPRGVNYMAYTAHLTGAIQALNEKIDNLNPSEAKKSVQDNYQWIVIGILIAWNLALTFKKK